MQSVRPDIITINQVDRGESRADARLRLDYRIHIGARTFEIYIESPSIVEFHNLEPAVPLAILPAMKLGMPIHVSGPLSKGFVNGVRKVIKYYSENFPEFSETSISADSYYDAESVGTGAKASFFSGGVDSFYTLLKGRGELTDIITIQGFDISLGDADRWNSTKLAAQATATEFGVGFHEVKSNFGAILKEYGAWLEHGHGLALASAARALNGRFEEIRIPSSNSVSEQIPWGSSAFTDPEFSDAKLAIIHDTCEATRADKTAYLADYPLALRYLRVCPGVRNDGYYNCCRCEKCLRTMVALYAKGRLEAAEAFPLPISPELVANALVTHVMGKNFVIENMALIKTCRPDDTAMLEALQTQYDRPIWMAKLLAKLRRKHRHLHKNLHRICSRMLSIANSR